MSPRPEHLGLGDPLLRVTLAGKAVIGVDRGAVGETFVNGVGWVEDMPRYISGQSGVRVRHPWFPEEEGFLLRLRAAGLGLEQMAAVLRRGLGGIKTKLGQLLIEGARP